MNYRLKRWIIFTLACVLLVPTLIYLAGWLLVGPYEGESGLFGLVMSIYGDALSGTLSTWFLLLSPMLLAVCWVLCARLSSDINTRLAKTG
jgi:hypothetical protein